ncbi:MAG: flavin reductase [Clostridia bacterium]|nr:flavin reductase [Clostridia bacterium]
MAMKKLSYGLFVVTTKNGGKNNGLITNTAIQVTTTPNVIAMAVNKASYSCGLIGEEKEFNVSIISEKAKFDLFKRFGFASGKDTNKFEGFSAYKVADNGITYITEGTNAVLTCKVINSVELSSHVLYIAEVTDSFLLNDDKSATYEYYFSNIKPKPQAQKPKKTVWRCSICGYEEEVDELPDDFLCPLCNHPKQDFEKIEA